jgi:hypothetical protein
MPTVENFRGLNVRNTLGASLLLLCLVRSDDVSGASMDYYRPYAAQTSQLLLTWAWQRAYTSCLNVEGEDPVVPETAQGALDVIAPTRLPRVPVSRPSRPEPPPGSVPATDPSDPTEDPKSKLVVVHPSGKSQPLCLAHHMRTVYKGHHWNCRK